MADRVRVQKREYGSKGGDPADDTPFIDEIDPNEDGVDCRSVFLQNDTSEDSNVEISRDASDPDNMIFRDEVQTTPLTLTQLASGALPPASEVGQFLFSYNGSTFEIVKPLVSDCGFTITDDDGHMVVVE